MWTIEFYWSASGKSPVKEWLDSLVVSRDENHAMLLRQVTRMLDRLEKHGNRLKQPDVDHLRTEGSISIWELRIRCKNNQFRILYAFNGETIVLLHYFAKKEQRVQNRHIDLAMKRMKEWLKHG